MRITRGPALAVSAVAMAAALAGCGGASAPSPPPAAPVTAGQVAARLHLVDFTDCGTAGLETADGGVAFDGKVKIGIDTFGSTAQRDNWERVSSTLAGITPWEQGPTWVAFRALQQTGGLCA